MKDIQLTLSLEEVNTLLNALGTQPYAQVQPLIAKIQTQGSTQLQAAQNGRVEVPKTAGAKKEKALVE
tara:strand:+ start:2077 stop:2280 length:204 start_codon:yes stop_codon:yes gene_type:complete